MFYRVILFNTIDIVKGVQQGVFYSDSITIIISRIIVYYSIRTEHCNSLTNAEDIFEAKVPHVLENRMISTRQSSCMCKLKYNRILLDNKI